MIKMQDDAIKMVEEKKETKKIGTRLVELSEFKESRYTSKPAATSIPTATNILDWISSFCQLAQLESYSVIVMIVYLQRLRIKANVALTVDTWKPLCSIALMLAQKLYDDFPLINRDFTMVYPVLSPAEINYLERRFLTHLDFTVLLPSTPSSVVCLLNSCVVM
jgi:hypothetical protein